ncbi:hypothetical protein RhiirA4_473756 [Rhizophagus irregularis]|uniref:Hsp70 family protein n=1 Tax=Rhizophagus irregularis TaxID=588596 RepID=A0A2I1H7A9_9GLOM|nr:hypothetical protein RhiirA4_473756 [Rhizophagus irregularis]
MSSEVIGKLITDFNNLNEKCVHLVEENQNLQQENQILKEKLQEKDKQLERLQEREKQYEKLEQHVKNLEKQKSEELQQLRQLEIISQNLHNNLGILGSDKNDGEQKNDIKITGEKNKFSTNKNDGHNNLGILASDKTKKNDIKIIEEKNEFLTFLTSSNKNEQTNHIMDKPPTLSLNNKDVNNSSEYFLNFFDTKKNMEKSKLYSNILVVIGLDFGSISSAFSIYRVVEVPNSSNYSWRLKDTSLDYNNDYSMVVDNSFLKYIYGNAVELFKLHLGGLPDNLKPKLPIEYKKAITDYLKGIGKDIKKEIAGWSGVNYFENVLLVLTVPAEYSEKDKDIMRECIHNAKLIKNKSSEKLQFITESEAAAIYCTKNELQKYNLLFIGMTFIIVDCGGNTTDISTHELVKNDLLQLSAIRDFCGCTFIDDEFIKLLNVKFETHAIDLLKKNKYYKFRHVVDEYCQHVKRSFTGDNTEFYYTVDVEKSAPDLLQYVSKETKEIMEENSWLIDLKYNDIKKMFDPFIDRIIRLIHIQLSNNRETCSAIFLIGGFSKNKYLQKRIKQEFYNAVKIISVIDQPKAAISHGAVDYGLLLVNSNLNKLGNEDISSSILKYTYGIRFNSNWKDDDPPNRKSSDGKISKFISLVKRDTEVTSDQIFTFNFKPESGQTHAKFEVYYTNEESATYIDEPGMKLLGVLNVDLPDAHLDNRSINFGLTFSPNKITAFARNELNGQKFVTKFCYQ